MNDQIFEEADLGTLHGQGLLRILERIRVPPRPDLDFDPEPDLDQTQPFNPVEPEPVPDFDDVDLDAGA